MPTPVRSYVLSEPHEMVKGRWGLRVIVDEKDLGRVDFDVK